MYILWCLLLCCGFSLHITQVEVIWNTYGLRIIHCVSCPYCSCSHQWPGVGRLTRTKPNLKNICCESSFVTTDLTWPAGGAVTVTRESPPNPAPCPVIASDSRVDIYLWLPHWAASPHSASAPATHLHPSLARISVLCAMTHSEQFPKQMLLCWFLCV